MSPSPNPAQHKRILVIRRDNIGDLVCTTPLISALRKALPQAWIGVLANSYNAPVLAGNADIDEVFAYTKGKHLGSGQEQFAALWRRLRLAMSLRRQRIDDVILPGGAQASATRFAGWVAPGRVIAAPLNGSTTEGRTSHEVERCFSLLAGYGIAGTPPPCHVVADPVLVQSIVVRLPSTLAGRRLVALQLSARKPKQRWPVELFAALAKTLHAESDCGFLVFWSPGAAEDPLHPGDDAKAAELVEQTRGLPLAAVATHELGELIAGLSLCESVICADGGAMHIAAGLGKPIVCLFGNSDATRWRPWHVPHMLLQPLSRDVADICVEEVLAAWRNLNTLPG